MNPIIEQAIKELNPNLNILNTKVDGNGVLVRAEESSGIVSIFKLSLEFMGFAAEAGNDSFKRSTRVRVRI